MNERAHAEADLRAACDRHETQRANCSLCNVSTYSPETNDAIARASAKRAERKQTKQCTAETAKAAAGRREHAMSPKTAAATHEGARSPEAEEAELDRLAQLSAIEYDRGREAAASRLGIRIGTLDLEVRKRRPTDPQEAGIAAFMQDVGAWHEEVDGDALLDELVAVFRRFIALSQFCPEALSLWTLHAWNLAAAYHTPLLALISPEKRCGKTRTISILRALVPRPLVASNISSAALFRAVEKWTPTLLVDEADSFAFSKGKDGNGDELRGILNSGHSRDAAYVVRTCGEDHEPRSFSTWGCKAIALIGSLPDTLEDRAIVIPMRRRRPDEWVDTFRGDRNYGLPSLARRCARWAADHAETLRALDPEIPAELNDRAGDNWRALLAIADEAGNGWPDRARAAARGLTTEEDAGSIRVQLLGDLRQAFVDAGTDRLPSLHLVEALVAREDRPWSDWRRGKPITPNGLARLLRPFGLRPRNLRIVGGVVKGYEASAFADAFARYLSPPPTSRVSTATPLQRNDSVDLRENPTATSPPGVAVENPPNPTELLTCSGVAVQKGGDAGEDTDGDLEEVLL